MAETNDISTRFRLTLSEMESLQSTMEDAFPLGALEQISMYGLGKELSLIVKDRNRSDKIFDLISWAETNNGIVGLLTSATKKTKNPDFLEIANQILNQFNHNDESLEKLLSKNPEYFQDTATFRNRMLRSEWPVCRIDTNDGEPIGTGFLIGSDLVMTCHHVKEECGTSLSNVRIQFGCRDSSDNNADFCYRLSERCCLIESATQQLDYAILELNGEASKDVIGGFIEPPVRGYLSLNVNEPVLKQPLFILQHPNGDPLKVATGGLESISGDWLDYYVNTKKGSSGSPVLDLNWNVVGLHSRFGHAQVNKGIRMSSIVRSLPNDLRSRITLSEI